MKVVNKYLGGSCSQLLFSTFFFNSETVMFLTVKTEHGTLFSLHLLAIESPRSTFSGLFLNTSGKDLDRLAQLLHGGWGFKPSASYLKGSCTLTYWQISPIHVVDMNSYKFIGILNIEKPPSLFILKVFPSSQTETPYSLNNNFYFSDPRLW